MPDRLSEYMSDRMPEQRPNRMSGRMPDERSEQNVRRLYHLNLQMICQKLCQKDDMQVVVTTEAGIIVVEILPIRYNMLQSFHPSLLLYFDWPCVVGSLNSDSVYGKNIAMEFVLIISHIHPINHLSTASNTFS